MTIGSEPRKLILHLENVLKLQKQKDKNEYKQGGTLNKNNSGFGATPESLFYIYY